jgi:hypothetical protein
MYILLAELNRHYFMLFILALAGYASIILQKTEARPRSPLGESRGGQVAFGA